MDIETKKHVHTKEAALGELFQEHAQTAYNICSACMGYDTCTFPMNLDRPLLNCAEFKPYESRPVQPDASTVEAVEEQESSEYLGLCRNCDIKEECTFTKPGKYVLNCEEYR